MVKQPSGPGERATAEASFDWEATYRDLLPRVYHFLWFRVGDPYIAEELAGSTFEKAWKSRQRLKGGRDGFSRWVFVIARNEASAYLRRKRDEAPLTEEMEDAEGEQPEERAAAGSDVSKLAKLLKGLGGRERELVGLKYGAGLTNRAISALTGLSESNVGTILHRVVGRLRREWEA